MGGLLVHRSRVQWLLELGRSNRKIVLRKPTHRHCGTLLERMVEPDQSIIKVTCSTPFQTPANEPSHGTKEAASS
jgi:hypothetical protein